jgi:hypothetical protein
MNNQNSILLIDPKFDPDTAVSCNLLLKIGADSFSYAIINKELNKVVAVYDEQEVPDVSLKLSERIKADPYLTLSFKESKIAVATTNIVDIPNEFYTNDAVKLQAKFFQQPFSGNIYTTSHSNFSFTSIFSFSSAIDGAINQSFANSHKYQQNTALLKLAESYTGNSLFIDFTVKSMQVLYRIETGIAFQQGYEIETVEEFNYYFLLISNQLGINLSEITLYVSGIIDQEDDRYSCLKKYLSHIKFLSPVDSNLDQQVLADMPAHYYTTLLALDQCAL